MTAAREKFLQCDVCPRGCRLKEGQKGFCLVRERREDAVVLSSYGYASGIALDPVEKKPLNHFYPGTGILSLGTVGCNLACKFCQNWNISKKSGNLSPDSLMRRISPEEIIRLAVSTKASSIAFTYNDPITWYEFAIDIASLAREAGIYSIAVSAGYATDKTRHEFFSKMDAANIDLKSFSDDFYRHMSSGRLQPVLDTIHYIAHETSTHLEITNLVIPGENDSMDEIKKMSDWILENTGEDTPVHFTGFTPHYRLNDHSPTSLSTLEHARKTALQSGLHYVYIGNRTDREGSTTKCPSCGKTLIERRAYSISTYQITEEGKCPQCGKTISGRFAESAGKHDGSVRAVF